ncbi:MAG TPA: hypothetical protein VII58_11665 [Acidobacteriaceae bacterium]
MSNFWTSTLISILPFVLILLFWFFLLRQMRKGKNTSQQTLIEPMRKVLQEEIVPEIRAIRESIDALTADLKARNERSDL